MKRLLPFIILFICSQAEARIFIKPFDQTGSGGGVSVSADITAVCDSGQTFISQGSGTWVCGATAGSPGGSDTHVQFNDASSFGGDAGFTYNKTTDSATLVGNLTVAAEVYGAGWNSDNTVPTKNDTYDGVEALRAATTVAEAEIAYGDSGGAVTSDPDLTWSDTTNTQAFSNDGSILAQDDLLLYGASTKVVDVASIGGAKYGGFANDFFNGVTAMINLTDAGSGAGSATSSLAGTVLHPGINSLSTGTTTTGIRVIYTAGNNSSILFGGGITRGRSIIMLPTLSDGTETYTIRSGFGDSATGAEAVDGCYFRYTDAVNSGEWEGVCRNNSSETARDTNVAVAANTWYELETEVNAAGGSTQFYINKSAAGAAVTTNIPTSTGRETGFNCASITKSAGTTARTAQLDFCGQGIVLTTQR